MGGGRDTLGVGTDKDRRMISGGKVIINAGKRGAQVEGKGGVVEISHHEGSVPGNNGCGMVLVEGKEGSGTVREGTGWWGEGIPTGGEIPLRGRGTLGLAREMT